MVFLIRELLLYAASSTLKSFNDWKFKNSKKLSVNSATRAWNKHVFKTKIQHLSLTDTLLYFTSIHYFCRVKVFYFSFYCRAASSLTSRQLVNFRSVDMETARLQQTRPNTTMAFQVQFSMFYVLSSTLLHLPPLRFHCIGGWWDRTQDCCDFGIGSQTL